MAVAENIYKSFKAREKSGDWAKFAADNPDANAMLIDLEKELEDGTD